MLPKPINPLKKLSQKQLSMLSDEDLKAIQANHDWHEANVELANLTTKLYEDFFEINKIGSQNHSQSDWWKRSAYRSLFAWIEGHIYGMKQVVLRAHKAGIGGEFSRAELEFLNEETHNINDGGKVKSKYRFIPLQSNMRFTFSMFERVYELDSKIHSNDEDWQNFIKALQVRNRLTHPKNLEDLILGEEEILLLTKVVAWFSQIANSIAEDATKFVKKLQKSKNVERDNRQKEYFDNIKRKMGQAATVEKVQNLIDRLENSSDNHLVVSKEEIDQLAGQLNNLKKELIEKELKEIKIRK